MKGKRKGFVRAREGESEMKESDKAGRAVDAYRGSSAVPRREREGEGGRGEAGGGSIKPKRAYV